MYMETRHLLMDRDDILRRCRYIWLNHMCQICWRSVKGFGVARNQISPLHARSLQHFDTIYRANVRLQFKKWVAILVQFSDYNFISNSNFSTGKHFSFILTMVTLGAILKTKRRSTRDVCVRVNQLFKGMLYHCVGGDVSDVINKTDCLNKGPPFRWVNYKYNFDDLGQVSWFSVTPSVFHSRLKTRLSITNPFHRSLLACTSLPRTLFTAGCSEQWTTPLTFLLDLYFFFLFFLV